tara:strand:- start:2127 stop:2561 length:435 start_codon:yes stop_codon:yes gene_type:complete
MNAAGVLIVVKSEVLLCKRILTYEGVDVPFGGYWAPFSGSSLERENPMITAIRELYEEAKIETSIDKLSFLFESQRENGRFIIYGIYLEEKPAYDVNSDIEHTDFKYFDRKNIEKYLEEYKIDSAVLTAIKNFNKKLDFLDNQA